MEMRGMGVKGQCPRRLRAWEIPDFPVTFTFSPELLSHWISSSRQQHFPTLDDPRLK